MSPRVKARRLFVRVALAGALWTTASARAVAQTLPTEPISIANGTVVLGGEITATIGQEDPGFFNYTDYEYSALRVLRVAVSAELRANRHVQVLGEVRADRGRWLEPYGLFVRLRPWPDRSFDIQAGRVPPTFGAFARSSYGSSNLLVGQPLAYQYLLSIRPDAIPANTSDLLRMRGRGWLSNFPVGDPSPGPGLPIVNTSRWDTGVQVHGVDGMVEWTGALTVGSLSDPRVDENNGGRQLAGRVVFRPSPALVLGVSAARGAWLDRTLDGSLPSGVSTADARQTAIAGDIEYSAGPVLVRSEVMRSSWTLPLDATPAVTRPLVARSVLVEGRYKVIPGLALAARGERLDFNLVQSATRVLTWEAPTWRLEAGPSVTVTRNVVLKAAWQRNRRDGGRVRGDTLVAARLIYWF
jgi:hypothetical protein